ncbi:hypothetical protein Vadar_030105 [Vaccinium darrowii]|uniref:Uncharacterized protein n=1 Tax=Vaccinium darrowii TaxID=229202 RepID=A0ACB7ZFF8_9ERIC|nr:hypothetical protein Vadar_030105 [Vaccinium darrowii]
MTKERIEKLLKAGANVVLTTKGIDDMALKYFVEAGAIAVRRVQKEDIRHERKRLILGHADEVVEERIADDDIILIKGTKTSSAVSLILRGANDSMLDEMERALHDSLSIVKRTLESNTVVVGGGAVEAALSVYLENLATTLGSREQLAIAEFAEAWDWISQRELSAMSKVKILQFATEAAITILRIDDMIRLVKDESQNGED